MAPAPAGPCGHPDLDPRDAGAYATLARAHGEPGWLSPTATAAWDAETLLAGQRQLAEAGRTLLFPRAHAEGSGELVGFPEQEFGADDAIIELYGLIVHPEHRRGGVGTALLAAALMAAHAHAPHIRLMRAYLPTDGEDVARMSRRLGFTDTAYFRRFTLDVG